MTEIYKHLMRIFIGTLELFLAAFAVKAENGHELWLRKQSMKTVKVVCTKNSATLKIARQELQQGWQGKAGDTIILAIKSDKSIKSDGYKFDDSGVQATTDLGILYGVFELLRSQQTDQATSNEVSK